MLERKYSGSRASYFSQTEDPAVLRCIRAGTRYALDLGTGTGRVAFLCAERSGFTLGVDINLDGLHVARSRTRPGTRVAFAAMEGAALGLRSESLDVVTAIGTFERTQDLRPVLREIARVLVPNGEVVFTCWNGGRWPKLELLDRRAAGSVLWTVKDVQIQTEQCGLNIKSMESIFFVPRRLLWWLYRLLLIEPLRRILLAASVTLEGRLGEMNSLAMAGRVLVVMARKTHQSELAYQNR
jgi:SAM-dependent methyltransferase